MSRKPLSRSAAMRFCKNTVHGDLGPPAQIEPIPKLERLNLVSPFSERINYSSYVAKQLESSMAGNCEARSAKHIAIDSQTAISRNRLLAFEIPLVLPVENDSVLQMCNQLKSELIRELSNVYKQLIREVNEVSVHLKAKHSLLTFLGTASADPYSWEHLIDTTDYYPEFSEIGGTACLSGTLQQVIEFCAANAIKCPRFTAQREFDLARAKAFEGEPLPVAISAVLCATETATVLPFSIKDVVQRVRAANEEACNDEFVEQPNPSANRSKTELNYELLVKKAETLERACETERDELQYWERQIDNEQLWLAKYSATTEAIERHLNRDPTGDLAGTFQVMQLRIDNILQHLQNFTANDWAVCERVLKNRVADERAARQTKMQVYLDNRWREEPATQLKCFVGKKCMSASPDRAKRRFVSQFAK